ncbi:oxidoreductase [Pilimelia terevasa]|uniref:Oxidoreductase n=1 Tax=Pilimelia terevasa TaxID=53372 RepID=A0A8J3BNK9_9ACTN|nr:FAD-binding oxidoreductase [Pilimelia terevasa]GGK34546.1 oxidoreductase [Pilimelia terevasa]
MTDLLGRLAAAVGPAHVLVDPDLRAPYETDWTRRFTGAARCVVRPADTAQVAAVLRACAAAGAPVTVQGGNTGLVGGGVPAGGEVLLSLGRLTELEPVDRLAAQVTAGAGVTLERLQRHARAAGLDVGVDLAARSAATVGGLVATNAGGVRVVRYGSMREQLTGVEAVLSDGTVLRRLAGLAKDNTGYDLTQLLAGSEGTLAVITRVRLRLVPLLPARAVALVAVDGVAGALDVLAAARSGLPGLSAAELMLADGLELVRAHGRLPAPFGAAHPAYVLVESAGRTDQTDVLLEVLAGCPAVRDATVAADATGVARLWAYRETHTEAISAAGVPVKLDVSVPVRALPGLVAALPPAVAAAAPAARLVVFGHLGEGNLHVNVLDARGAADAVTDAVLRLVADRDGSISSEHGVGRAKTAWLGLSRDAAQVALMRRIRAAVDPAGLLNPGVLFEEKD